MAVCIFHLMLSPSLTKTFLTTELIYVNNLSVSSELFYYILPI